MRMHDREMNGFMDVMFEICIYLIIESDDPERQYLQTMNKKGSMNKWLMKAKDSTAGTLNPKTQRDTPLCYDNRTFCNYF
jgi:hypothetical protein